MQWQSIVLQPIQIKSIEEIFLGTNYHMNFKPIENLNCLILKKCQITDSAVISRKQTNEVNKHTFGSVAYILVQR